MFFNVPWSHWYVLLELDISKRPTRRTNLFEFQTKWGNSFIKKRFWKVTETVSALTNQHNFFVILQRINKFGVAFLWHPVSVSVKRLLHTTPILFSPILFGAEAV